MDGHLSFVVFVALRCADSFIRISLHGLGLIGCQNRNYMRSLRKVVQVVARYDVAGMDSVRCFASKPMTDIQAANGAPPVRSSRKAIIYSPSKNPMQSGSAQTLQGMYTLSLSLSHTHTRFLSPQNKGTPIPSLLSHTHTHTHTPSIPNFRRCPCMENLPRHRHQMDQPLDGMDLHL